jgi:GTP cyclohydrolase I
MIQLNIGARSYTPTEVQRVANAFYDMIAVASPHTLEEHPETPLRAAKAFLHITTPPQFTATCFEQADFNGMVIQNGIWIGSLCEHHLLPFFGSVSIGYIPGLQNRIIGLSKLARIAKASAAGLRTQERVTELIASTLMNLEGLSPAGVAVSTRCRHCCMSMRGVHEPNAFTDVQCVKGVFLNDAATRAEFERRIVHAAV